jgi:hypothetical protein
MLVFAFSAQHQAGRFRPLEGPRDSLSNRAMPPRSAPLGYPAPVYRREYHYHPHAFCLPSPTCGEGRSRPLQAVVARGAKDLLYPVLSMTAGAVFVKVQG